jgi:hypothetical protein
VPALATEFGGSTKRMLAIASVFAKIGANVLGGMCAGLFPFTKERTISMAGAMRSKHGTLPDRCIAEVCNGSSVFTDYAGYLFTITRGTAR